MCISTNHGQDKLCTMRIIAQCPTKCVGLQFSFNLYLAVIVHMYAIIVMVIMKHGLKIFSSLCLATLVSVTILWILSDYSVDPINKIRNLTSRPNNNICRTSSETENIGATRNGIVSFSSIATACKYTCFKIMNKVIIKD